MFNTVTHVFLIINLPRVVCNGKYFRQPCYGYALDCHFIFLSNTMDTSVIYEKQNLLVLIYMQLQKVKFTSFQVNMNQVSYFASFLVLQSS